MPLADWAPLATASGTVVAAIIAGFGAAISQHSWDKKDDKLRFTRETAVRQGAALTQAWRDYRTARRDLESLCQTWSVAKRQQLAPNPDPRQKTSWTQPQPETEIVNAGTRLRQAADELVLNAMSHRVVDLVRSDADLAREHSMTVINNTMAGESWMPLAPSDALTKAVRTDLQSQAYNNVPIILHPPPNTDSVTPTASG